MGLIIPTPKFVVITPKEKHTCKHIHACIQKLPYTNIENPIKIRKYTPWKNYLWFLFFHRNKFVTTCDSMSEQAYLEVVRMVRICLIRTFIRAS